MSFDGGIGGPFAFIIAVIGALVLIAAWVILAGSRFVQGGVVERPDRVPQLYGYTVSLIGLLMAVAAVLSIANAALTLRAPEQGSGSDWGMVEPSGWGSIVWAVEVSSALRALQLSAGTSPFQLSVSRMQPVAVGWNAQSSQLAFEL